MDLVDRRLYGEYLKAVVMPVSEASPCPVYGDHFKAAADEDGQTSQACYRPGCVYP